MSEHESRHSEYALTQRRRAQALEDKLFDIRHDATVAFNGVKGTGRKTGSDRVTVEFTDEGWEACKRLLTLAENAA